MLSEKTYWSKEISDLLGIGASTLRKWCLILEQNGYIFLRDEHGRRAYTEHDVIALRRFKELTTDKSISLENASIVVVSTLKRSIETAVTISATGKNSSDMCHEERYFDKEEFASFVEQQRVFNQTLIDELQKRDEYIQQALQSIDSRLESRDAKLMETLNLVLETKKLLAATQEVPKKKWYQFWKSKY